MMMNVPSTQKSPAVHQARSTIYSQQSQSQPSPPLSWHFGPYSHFLLYVYCFLSSINIFLFFRSLFPMNSGGLFSTPRRYLMPLGDQPAVRKLLSDPSSLMFSASQFLALIPPYLKSTADGEFALEEEVTGSQVQKPPSLLTIPNFSAYLKGAHRLVTERNIACSFWSFPYNFESPSPSQVAAAHLNGSLLLPLPRNGYKVSQVDSVAGVDFIDGNWDLDEISFHGDAPDDPDSNSLLADLDRFSALLQRRPLPTSSNRAQTATSPSLTKAKLRTLYASRHSNAVVPAAASANRRRSSYYRSSRDVERLEEDIKRTSSLYDITYTDFDERDEEVVEDDARSFTTTVPKMHSVDTPHTHANHHSSDLNLECYLRPTGDCQPSVTVELDNLLDEAAGIALQHCLTEGQPEREDIMEEFMDVLDRLPTTLSENDASTEEILAQLQKTADELSASRCRHPARVKEEQGEGALKPTNPATLPPKPASSLAAGSRAGRAACPPCGGGGSGGGSDSGVVSLDRQSGRCRESASSPAACCSNFCLRSSRADSDLVPLYPGPLLSVLLQLLSRLPLNHFFVNLLLTSVIAKLVSFPIPILRTLLLTMPTGHLVPPGPGSLPPSSDCCFSLARRDLTSEFPRSMPLQLHNFLFSVRQWMDCYVNLTLPKAVVSSPSASSSSVWRGKKLSSSSVADGPDGLLPHRFAQISASVRALLSDNGLLRNISVNAAPPAVSDTGRSRLTSLFMNRKGASIDKSNSPLQPPTTSASDWCTPTCPDLDAVFAGAFHDQPVCGGFDSERSRHIILSCLIFEDFCMELSAICLEQSTFV
uniref:FHF complex subunit HOOK-interacting protein C-terminal domain-containing protein n=1 Tax=Schistocephalus solidus TaxID=70667 RepID=A0A0V0J5U9_SCHSO